MQISSDLFTEGVLLITGLGVDLRLQDFERATGLGLGLVGSQIAGGTTNFSVDSMDESGEAAGEGLGWFLTRFFGPSFGGGNLENGISVAGSVPSGDGTEGVGFDFSGALTIFGVRY